MLRLDNRDHTPVIKRRPKDPPIIQRRMASKAHFRKVRPLSFAQFLNQMDEQICLGTITFQETIKNTLLKVTLSNGLIFILDKNNQVLKGHNLKKQSMYKRELSIDDFPCWKKTNQICKV